MAYSDNGNKIGFWIHLHLENFKKFGVGFKEFYSDPKKQATDFYADSRKNIIDLLNDRRYNINTKDLNKINDFMTGLTKRKQVNNPDLENAYDKLFKGIQDVFTKTVDSTLEIDRNSLDFTKDSKEEWEAHKKNCVKELQKLTVKKALMEQKHLDFTVFTAKIEKNIQRLVDGVENEQTVYATSAMLDELTNKYSNIISSLDKRNLLTVGANSRTLLDLVQLRTQKALFNKLLNFIDEFNHIIEMETFGGLSREKGAVYEIALAMGAAAQGKALNEAVTNFDEIIDSVLQDKRSGSGVYLTGDQKVSRNWNDQDFHFAYLNNDFEFQAFSSQRKTDVLINVGQGKNLKKVARVSAKNHGSGKTIQLIHNQNFLFLLQAIQSPSNVNMLLNTNIFQNKGFKTQHEINNKSIALWTLYFGLTGEYDSQDFANVIAINNTATQEQKLVPIRDVISNIVNEEDIDAINVRVGGKDLSQFMIKNSYVKKEVGGGSKYQAALIRIANILSDLRSQKLLATLKVDRV